MLPWGTCVPRSQKNLLSFRGDDNAGTKADKSHAGGRCMKERGLRKKCTVTVSCRRHGPHSDDVTLRQFSSGLSSVPEVGSVCGAAPTCRPQGARP